MPALIDIPGQKVVLVDDRWPDNVLPLYTHFPKLGETYVVREVRLGVDAAPLEIGQHVGEISITLVGLVNPKSLSRPNLERGFRASRFRLLEQSVAVAPAKMEEVQT